MIPKDTSRKLGTEYDDFLYDKDQAVNEQLGYLIILAKNLETGRQATPYTIKLPYLVDTKEIGNWLTDNKVEIITDAAAIGIMYRFKDLEIATMFKLIFGGEFVDVTIQEG